MFCPEGYFTPHILLNELRQSLGRAQISTTVFESGGVDFNAIQAVHRNVVLDFAAQLFLHHFVSETAAEIRLCDPQKSDVMRVDPWAVKRAFDLPTQLVTTAAKAETQIVKLERNFSFIDTELWVLDTASFNLPGPQSKTIDWIRRFDGWSLCFQLEQHPNDVGSYMNNIALTFAEQENITPLQPVRKGRPTKIDDLVSIIAKQFPHDVKKQTAKEVRRAIQHQIPVTFGDTILRQAINIVHDKAS